MPSSVGFNRAEGTRQAEELANVNARVEPIVGQAPWHGYLPDLDVAHLGANASGDVDGLIPRGDESGLGEILGKFPGYDHVDSTYAATGTGKLGDDAGTQNDITGLIFFSRVNTSGVKVGEFEDTLIAITAGDETAGAGQVYRIKPSSGVWDEIAEAAGGAGPSAAMIGSYPGSIAGSTAQLVDFAVLPAQTALRTGLTATDVATPTLVWTNNFDAVKMYSVRTAGAGTSEDGEYEDLTEAFGNGASSFKCRSVEAWGDRLNFLNTVESGIRHRQRLRRTAIGEPDPDSAGDGSGAIDLQDFQGEGLRVEGMGNVLACYFEDGVAFVRRTGQAVSPYSVQIVTKERGLLATHAVVDVGSGIHFGLFTDGWFFLNEGGQFQEAGMENVEGTPTHKWRNTFFNRLDDDNRDRIDMVYDASTHLVKMTLPLDGMDQNSEVWYYDIHADRVFTRPISITKFGTTNLQLSTGTTIGNLTGTIGELIGTIGSFSATFGLKTMVHGTADGHVVADDPNLTTIVNAAGGATTESWKYTTILSGVGRSHFSKAIREIAIEGVRTTTGSFTIKVSGNIGDRTETQTYTINSGSAGDVQTLVRGFRYSGAQMQVEIAGSVPFNIRSFTVDIRDTGSRVRRVA